MTTNISLAGKVALVTGGGRGIGKGIAKRFAEAGANVVIASRKLENLEATAQELAGLPGRVIPIACHVGRLDQIENLIHETESQLGPVDILVNNSATNLGQGPALEVTDEMLDKMVEINIKAAIRLVRLTVSQNDRAWKRIDHQHQFGRRCESSTTRIALQFHESRPDHDDTRLGSRIQSARPCAAMPLLPV